MRVWKGLGGLGGMILNFLTSSLPLSSSLSIEIEIDRCSLCNNDICSEYLTSKYRILYIQEPHSVESIIIMSDRYVSSS